MREYWSKMHRLAERNCPEWIYVKVLLDVLAPDISHWQRLEARAALLPAMGERRLAGMDDRAKHLFDELRQIPKNHPVWAELDRWATAVLERHNGPEGGKTDGQCHY